MSPLKRCDHSNSSEGVRSFASFGCAALLLVVSSPPLHAMESFEYRPDALPQEAQPAWQQLGAGKQASVTVEGRVLRVISGVPEFTQWRIGHGSQESGRGFGDSQAMPIEPGGSLTVDLRVRLSTESDPSDQVAGFNVWVTNGEVSATLALLPGYVSFGGVKDPKPVESADWADYRIVVEGSRITYLFLGTSVVVDLSSSPGKDDGRFIAFGVPQWTEAGDAVPMRGFEIQSVRWYPGQALYAPPEAPSP